MKNSVPPCVWWYACLCLCLCLLPSAGCTPAEPVASPTTATEETPATTPDPASPAADPPTTEELDLTYVTDVFTAAIVVHPARILETPLLKELAAYGVPVDQPIRAFQQFVSAEFEPSTVDQMIVLYNERAVADAPEILRRSREDFSDASDLDTEGETDDEDEESKAVEYPTVIVRFNAPYDKADYLAIYDPPLKAETIAGMEAYVISDADISDVFVFPDDKTFIATTKALLPRLAARDPANGPLVTQLRATDPSRDLIVVGELGPVKPLLDEWSAARRAEGRHETAVWGEVSARVERISLTWSLTGDSLFELTVTTDDEVTAAQVNAVLLLLREAAWAESAKHKPLLETSFPPLDPEATSRLVGLFDNLYGGFTVELTGRTVVLTVPKPRDLDQLVAILKPVLERAKADADAANRVNDFKQLGLAFHNHHDVHHCFPGAGCGAEGKYRGLSWRVHLLPFLDQTELYRQFHLDEPWDSEHNKTLIPLMPSEFACEGVEEEGKTSVHVFVGKHAFPIDQSLRFTTFTDGTSFTILAVEAGPDKAEIWTKPGGLTPDETAPRNALGNIGETFPVLFGDGAVTRLPASIDPNVLKGLITRDGGERVSPIVD